MLRKNKKKMNFIERVMVQHANPRKLILDIVGIIVAMYFFWQHNLLWAILSLFGLTLLGSLLAWGKKEDALAKTPLGKFMLGQTHPMNLFLRIVGVIILSYALWLHSALYILLGISFIIIARQWKSKRLG